MLVAGLAGQAKLFLFIPPPIHVSGLIWPPTPPGLLAQRGLTSGTVGDDRDG